MLWLFVPIVIFTADYFLKRRIEREPDDYGQEIMGGRIHLCKYHNEGAMLNVMEKRPHFVTGFSFGIAVSIAIACLSLLGRRGMHLLKAALSLMIGGGCSNVYDRMARHYVVDYFSFNVKWKKFRKIVFNLSDICIFLGAGLYIFWNSRRKS